MFMAMANWFCKKTSRVILLSTYQALKVWIWVSLLSETVVGSGPRKLLMTNEYVDSKSSKIGWTFNNFFSRSNYSKVSNL